MNKEEIKEILDKLKDSNWYDELDLTGTRWIELTWKETHLLLDYIKNLQQKVEQLEKENKILKENAEHNDKVVDKVNWENMLLKKEKNTEIDRLNNIINELEKYLNQEIIEWQDASDLWTKAQVKEDKIILNKLKELKDSD